MYYSGNNNKEKNLHMFGTDAFFPDIFDLRFAEAPDVKPIERVGQLCSSPGYSHSFSPSLPLISYSPCHLLKEAFADPSSKIMSPDSLISFPCFIIFLAHITFICLPVCYSTPSLKCKIHEVKDCLIPSSICNI